MLPIPFLRNVIERAIPPGIFVIPHRSLHFEVGGIPHRWVTWGDGGGGDAWLLERFPNLIRDVQQVCLSCCRLMGEERPASDSYGFVLHLLDEGYGGLEHDDSTVLVYGRQRLEQPQGYRRLLQLVAHEYLHQWNVRRLRPADLVFGVIIGSRELEHRVVGKIGQRQRRYPLEQFLADRAVEVRQ